MSVNKEQAEQVMDQLAGSGRLVAAGFEALRIVWIPPDAPAVQVDEMRMAFFAGAQHLFSSIMFLLEEGGEATDQDMLVMIKISEELDEFVREFKLRMAPTGRPQ